MISLTAVQHRAWWVAVTLAVRIFCATPALALPNADIVFVGQIPNPTDFATANAVFGNHLATVESVVRGGDLFIRYRNGTVRNLTRAAGFGNSGFQGAGSIAVRDPSVSWDGTKVLFSMVVGAPTEQYQEGPARWQLYEISRLGAGETPLVSKVPFQPESFNNVSPVYGIDDTIFFTSDRPRNGAMHLYPQRDEYESQPTNTGIWNLNPATGTLRLLDHAPSGAFEPFMDSFGRLVYTRWDHLQRDQQADESDAERPFNFSSESATAARLSTKREVFPEPRIRELITDNRTNPHSFNHFFPWMINPDGTGHETINHIGRHELHGYFDRSFNDDDNLEEHYGEQGEPYQREIENFLQIHEDPRTPGLYFGVDAPEFTTHAAGQVITLRGDPARNGDQMPLTYMTDRSTSNTDPDNLAPEHSGLYRDPLPVSDGSIVVSHTSSKVADENIGSVTHPLSRYSFRLKTLAQSGSTWRAGALLTSGIQANVSYYTPDELASYSGALWELQPVELVARTRPEPQRSRLEAPELQVFQGSGVNVQELTAALAQRNLALIVMRNITSRDKADLQQPFNLRVPNGSAQSIKQPGKIYDVSFLQLFQGDQVRGYGGTQEPEDGRRVLATLLHDGMNANPRLDGAPLSSVQVAADGSVAAIVPARRALSWQLTDPNGEPVVRERYWLTFQPGEIRVCAGCHGANSRDQLGRPSPSNPPQALGSLLQYLRSHPLPDNGENDPPPPSKQYSLQVTGPAGGAVTVGRPAAIRVGVSPAAQDRLTVRLTVNDRRCPNDVATVLTPASGRVSIQGRVAPINRSGVRLYFTLLRAGVTVAEARAALSMQGVRAPRGGAVSLGEFRALCRSFAAFR